MDNQELRRLKELEEENRKLKHMFMKLLHLPPFIIECYRCNKCCTKYYRLNNKQDE